MKARLILIGFAFMVIQIAILTLLCRGFCGAIQTSLFFWGQVQIALVTFPMFIAIFLVMWHFEVTAKTVANQTDAIKSASSRD